MSEIVPARAIPLPVPQVDVAIRAAVETDIPAIDRLQKAHGKQLGFMNRPTLEGKVSLGHVLVAESGGGGVVGYLIGNDRYKHRDELGVIFQLCVAPEYRRSLVAANLLRAQFQRSAYGCRLYCCWCAQDIEANRFWESMGFVALAFRAGSEKRNRVHIFWQKRIREGDVSTPWWFPSVTAGGAMDAARVALPIPPGMRWSDELPRLVKTDEKVLDGGGCEVKQIEVINMNTKRVRVKKERMEGGGGAATEAAATPVARPCGLWFRVKTEPVKAQAVKKREKKERVKKFPGDVMTKARELRDRWLEHVNGNELSSEGKYDLRRELELKGAPLLLPDAA